MQRILRVAERCGNDLRYCGRCLLYALWRLWNIRYTAGVRSLGRRYIAVAADDDFVIAAASVVAPAAAS